MGYQPLSFVNLGTVGEKDDSIKHDKGSNYYVFLIESSGPTARGYCFKMDTLGAITLTTMNEKRLESNRVVKLGKLDNEFLLSRLNTPHSANGFYFGYCEGSSRYSYSLIVENSRLNKHIEFSSLDMPLTEVLKGNGNYAFLLNILTIVKKYFPYAEF